ncbi:hypothetical protein F2Q70_00038775 [Brassica cretica]|uniref:Uncharacterized protein n=1 Tax=Brassica cretica TaxID=69181 RepID=A0A3N6SCJ6_BRACR|nr:hypothetical protein F2Q70_00038775 [Brassica cretica]KAF3497071.1 hypothetical protein DY000_02053050 [Brassica cretica]
MGFHVGNSLHTVATRVHAPLRVVSFIHIHVGLSVFIAFWASNLSMLPARVDGVRLLTLNLLDRRNEVHLCYACDGEAVTFAILHSTVTMESCIVGDTDECKSGEAKIRKLKHDFTNLAFGNRPSLEARFVWYEFKRIKGKRLKSTLFKHKGHVTILARSVFWLQKFELMFSYLCELQQKLEKPQEHKLMEKPFQRELSGSLVVTLKIILLMFDPVKNCIFARHVKNNIWVSSYMRSAYGRMKKMSDLAGYAFLRLVVSKSSDNKRLPFKKQRTRGLMGINNAKVQKIARKRVNTKRQQLTKQSVPPSFWRKYLSSDQSSDYSNYF